MHATNQNLADMIENESMKVIEHTRKIIDRCKETGISSSDQALLLANLHLLTDIVDIVCKKMRQL